MNTQRGIAPIAAIIIALLVVGGGAYGVKKVADKKKEKRETPTAVDAGMPVPDTQTLEMETAKETTVTYTSAGFAPKTITIKRGGTVVFENKTSKNASVASDEHPTHLLYPEFDQYKTDQRGKTEFRFTFEKAGTWKYHDHLNAIMGGTIIVTE